MPAGDDERFMRMALRLGRRGVGYTSPNPPVGAVVVGRGGVVVGRGYHRRAGLPHAEREALADAGQRARGATLYVTLEPCAHHGRTPPCVDAVVDAGIRRVVFGSTDPNPTVTGGGADRLRSRGVAVSAGTLQEPCEQLIAAFRKHVRTGLPRVTLKLAASLDGRIATAGGESRWITGPDSRHYVHRLRAEHDAILVGAETIRRDDPELTCRLRGQRSPIRIVLDGRARIPLQARVLTSTRPPATVVAVDRDVPAARLRRIEAVGAEVLRLPASSGKIPMRRLLRALGRRGVMSVLIEGGSTVAAAALSARVVDELCLFYAPKLIGADGRAMIGALGVKRISQALRLGPLRVKRFSQDVLIVTEMVHDEHASG
jgi:diaminohydroxyphosphoribosylaminopyrimidine deaminase/5-amino-6-(5-phosphoribosylamino)uracil reductase